MNQKMKLLIEKKLNLHITDSPLMISEISILKDIEKGEIIGYAKFKNMSYKIINAIVFSAEAKDVLGNSLGNTEEIQCLDLVVESGECCCNKYPIIFTDTRTRNFEVKLHGIVFEDGEIWEADKSKLYSIENKVINEAHLDNKEAELEEVEGIIGEYSFHSSKGMKGGWLLGRIVNDIEVLNNKVTVATIPEKYSMLTEFELSDIKSIQCKKAISLMGIVRTIIFAILAYFLTPVTLLVAALLIVWIDLNDKIIITLKNGKEIILYSNYRNETKRFLQDFAQYVIKKGEQVKSINSIENKSNGDKSILIAKLVIVFGVLLLVVVGVIYLYPMYYHRTNDIKEASNTMSDWNVKIITTESSENYSDWYNMFSEYETWYIHFLFENSTESARAEATCVIESSSGEIYTSEFEGLISDGDNYCLEISEYTFEAGDVVTITVFVNGKENSSTSVDIGWN